MFYFFPILVYYINVSFYSTLVSKYKRTYVLKGVLMNVENCELLKSIQDDLKREYEEIQVMQSDRNISEEEKEILISKSCKLSVMINKIDKILNEELDHNVTILKIQEDERQRISRDLHDSSLQNLTHLIHKIELSSMFIDNDPLRAKLELSVISKNLKSIIDDIRNTIFNLRPMEFDDLGLQVALERLLHRVTDDLDFKTEFDVENVSCENNLVLMTLYRVVQECLNNVVKHSEATEISLIGKRVDNTYHIIIKDNGKGFTKEEVELKKKNHFGMSLMRERISIIKGNVIVHSESGKGTEIKFVVPIDDDLVIR